MDETNEYLLILIVDDNPRNLQLLGTTLRSQGYRVAVAQNGLQALESVKAMSPDLILLDIMMPEVDGFETCRRLKEDPETCGIPVIFLTARIEAEDIVRGFELGAVDYVTKPFNATELLVRARSHLGRILLQRALDDRTDEIARLQREQEAFLRYELQDRLKPILDCAELLSKLGGDKLDGHESEWVTTILDGARDMARLSDELRQLQDFEAGRYRLQSRVVDLGSLIAQTIADLRIVFGNLVAIRCDDNLDNGSVEGDQELLAKAFLNLIESGAKHAIEAQESVDPRTHVGLYNENGYVDVEINSSGRAIPAERLESFFDKFSADWKGEGTGLRSAYAYLVTRVHGGEISVTSGEAGGTTVRVRLPVASTEGRDSV